MRKFSSCLALALIINSALYMGAAAAPTCPSKLIFKFGDNQIKATALGFDGWTTMEIVRYAIPQAEACKTELKSIAFLGSGADTFRAIQQGAGIVFFGGEGTTIGILVTPPHGFSEDQVLPRGFYRFKELRRYTKINGFQADVPVFEAVE